jgi:hypothetical protein
VDEACAPKHTTATVVIDLREDAVPLHLVCAHTACAAADDITAIFALRPPPEVALRSGMVPHVVHNSHSKADAGAHGHLA